MGRLLSSVEVYDPATGEWTVGAALKEQRSGHSCVAWENKLWVLGGQGIRLGGQYERTCWLSSMVVYDPATEQWESEATQTGLDCSSSEMMVLEYVEGPSQRWLYRQQRPL